MQFLISPAIPEQLAEDTSDLFVGEDDGKYNIKIDWIQGEMATIVDSIGRLVPIDVNDFKSLAEVFARLARFEESKRRADTLMYFMLTNSDNIVQ